MDAFLRNDPLRDLDLLLVERHRMFRLRDVVTGERLPQAQAAARSSSACRSARHTCPPAWGDVNSPACPAGTSITWVSSRCARVDGTTTSNVPPTVVHRSWRRC